MVLSLNCLILGQTSNKCFTEDIGQTYCVDSKVEVEFSNFKVLHFKEKLIREQIIKDVIQDKNKMDLWKVNSQKVDEEENNLQKFTESDIKDKLGGEEMNPRYLFIPTSTGPSQQGISKVTTIFEEFLNSKHGEFLKKYIEKNDPLPSYESRIQLKSIVPASFTGGHPTLLKYNLPKSNENHEPITQVSNVQFAIAEAKNNLLIFLGTSGCGKMRTCYELLCENWGLYFVASRKENGGLADIEKIQTYLETKMTKFRQSFGSFGIYNKFQQFRHSPKFRHFGRVSAVSAFIISFSSFAILQSFAISAEFRFSAKRHLA
ncbi:hypothetical protein RirG_244360 [Rhizophagus irregularis DAOM 197198w]|uniref:Uncharacterized protein n=1 Tax=Rhizophagus irregularis (strain DAOM 197198w) TaxID=1432141 RepID=A0A015IH71_RHIIW|nr:hypothetical protein RirG_244360 [Rhizophagus irregularis DAOM 197198w]